MRNAVIAIGGLFVVLLVFVFLFEATASRCDPAAALS